MITVSSMGCLPTGEEVRRYRIENAKGNWVEISTLGGSLMKLYIPDRNGVKDDVLICYDTVEGILEGGGYMGRLIGRYANRIGNASFELDGQTYHVGANENGNMLHGGHSGFDRKVWADQVNGDALELSMVSPDGEEGFPGTMQVKVTYTFSDEDVLGLKYEAVCDKNTVINLSNHAYFNLEGSQSVSNLDHVFQIDGDYITALADKKSIPTGELMPVDGTPFDLREPHSIRECLEKMDTCQQMIYGNGFDHNYALNHADGTLRYAVRAYAPKTGRVVEVWTDQPGVQMYGGNFLGDDEIIGKFGKRYAFRQAFCLETQHFPDSPNHPHFPSTVLKAGEKYETRTEYRFSVCE